MGHVTEFTAYNADGRPLSLIDPNGLVTTFSYDVRRGRRNNSIGGESTAYTTGAAGLLTRVTFPDGTPGGDYVWLGEQPLAIIE